ncbi:MAG: hypothetical protein LBM93_04330 [Oscillospiraceae bacterium]|nr:hypothetical protein [Oscillospiraceae bacterium]
MKTIIASVVVTLFFAIFPIIMFLCKTEIVLSKGIRDYNLLFKLSFIPVLISAVSFIAYFIKIGIKRNNERKILEKQKQRALDVEKTAKEEEMKRNKVHDKKTGQYNIDGVREGLYGLQARCSGNVTADLEKCIGQLDAVAKRRQRLKALLEANAAGSMVKYMEDIFSSAEQNMCGNFHKILNYGIVFDTGENTIFEPYDPGYEEFGKIIIKSLEENNLLFPSLDRLIEMVRVFIDEHRVLPQSSDEIEGWINAFKRSLRGVSDD